MNVVTKRFFGYDALKALAAFFVVLYHVDMVDFGYREGVYYIPTLVQVLWLFCACGVPLFFMVNGALTVNRKYDMKKTMMKSGRLLRAGIIWGIIAICVNAFCKQDMSYFSLTKIPYYWFLFTLAILYVANYILGQLPRWCKWIIVAALLVFPFSTNLFWDIKLLLNPEISTPSWGHIGVFTLYGLVYLYAGDYLVHHRIGRWIPWTCALVGLALLALEATAVVNHTHEPFEGGNYCFPTMGALLLSIALFVWLKDLDVHVAWIKGFVTFLGDNALGIYVFHLLLMVIIGRFLPNVNGYLHPLLAILITFGYVIASAGLSELLRRSPLGFLLKL